MDIMTIFLATRFDEISWPAADDFADVSNVDVAELPADTLLTAERMGVDSRRLALALAQARERVVGMCPLVRGDFRERQRAVESAQLYIRSHGDPWGASLNSAEGRIEIRPALLLDAAERNDWNEIRGMLARALRPLASSSMSAQAVLDGGVEPRPQAEAARPGRSSNR